MRAPTVARAARLLLASASLSLGLLAASCDFDAAYERYCAGNPACLAADGGDASAPDGGFGGDGGSAGDASMPWTPPKNCQHESDCREHRELCHPVGKVCVPRCRTSADCPDDSDCAPLVDLMGEPTFEKVCQCTSASRCAMASPGTTCSPVDNLCEKMCAGSADCSSFWPPRICDASSGACLLAPANCSTSADCASPTAPKCDPYLRRCSRCFTSGDCSARTDGLNDCDSLGACVAFNPCDPSNPVPGRLGGPDTCRYGQVCAVSTCALVQNGSCYGALAKDWDLRDWGPVVTSALGSVSSTKPGECPERGEALIAVVDFYAPRGFTVAAQWWPVTSVTFLSPGGGRGGAGRFAASFVRDAPAPDAPAGRFTAGLCGVSSFAGWSVVLSDEWDRSGNAMCLK